MTALTTTRERLVSFGGDSSVCEVATPTSTDELVDVLRQADLAGRRITFRGGGHCFDTQSLNDDLVVSLAALNRFELENGRAHLGPGVRSGELLDQALAHGLVPHVMVTTEDASIGGTASGNCVSRFSPIYGQDGDWVRELELVTVTGERHTFRPTHDEFHAVIGGLGYLGAITRVTVELKPDAHDQVETTRVLKGKLDDVLAACGPEAKLEPGATRYAVLRPTKELGIVYQSRYVTGQRFKRYCPVHVPRSWFRLVGETLLLTHLGSRLVWWLGYHTVGKRYVDPIRDFTFFMDGNVRFKKIGRRLGRTMRVVQQSFVMPVDTTARFIREAHRIFCKAHLVPMLSDVLHCLPDRSLLSATYERNGFFVTFAFSPWLHGRFERAKKAFETLSNVCGELGGRVHLTKNVHAAPADLQAMYSNTLPEFLKLKQRFDPNFRIRNEFLERTFPSLAP